MTSVVVMHYYGDDQNAFCTNIEWFEHFSDQGEETCPYVLFALEHYSDHGKARKVSPHAMMKSVPMRHKHVDN